MKTQFGNDDTGMYRDPKQANSESFHELCKACIMKEEQHCVLSDVINQMDPFLNICTT